MCHGLLAVGAVAGGAKEGLAAAGTAECKDELTIGAYLGTGEEFHSTPRAGEGKFQFTLGAVLGGFAHGRAAAGAQGGSAGGAGGVSAIDARTTAGTYLVARLVRLWRGICLDTVPIPFDLGAALKDEPAVRAGCVV